MEKNNNSYTPPPLGRMISTTAPSTWSSMVAFFNAFKRISSIALPMGLSYTFSFSIVAINLLLNRLQNDDEKATAAIALITSTLNAVIVIAVSPLFSMSGVANFKRGQLKKTTFQGAREELIQEIGAVNRSGIILSTVIIPPTFLALFFSKTLLTHWFKQDEDVAQITQDFLRIYSIAVPALVLRTGFEQMMFSFDKTTAAMVIGLINFTLGTLLAYWLGFGGAGLSGMGTAAVAIAYVIEAYVTSLCFGLYIGHNRSLRQEGDYRFFHFFEAIKKIPQQVWEVLKPGLSMLFTFFNEMILTFAITIAAGLTGTTEQAALTFALQLVFFNIILQLCFAQTIYQEMNTEIGRGEYAKAGRLGKFGLIIASIYTTPFPILFSIFPTFLMNLLGNHNETVQKIAKIVIPIISLGTIFDALRVALLQQLRAVKNLLWSAVISVASLWLGGVLAFILGPGTNLGIKGVVAGFAGGMGVAFFSLFALWSHQIQPRVIASNQQKRSPTLACHCIPDIFKLCRRRRYTAISEDEHPVTENIHQP